jgi:hypothetical protein
MRTIIHAMALAFHPGGNIRPQAPVYRGIGSMGMPAHTTGRAAPYGPMPGAGFSPPGTKTGGLPFAPGIVMGG